jgi:hypothetical protein
MIKHYMQLSVTVKDWLWAVILTVCLALFASGFWSVRANTTTGNLTATAQVTAAPTPLMPMVIQHGLHTAVKELPLGVTVHTQQISPAHIRVTITYY